MARKLRTRGTSGVYHVLMEGTRNVELFQDEEDYEQFLGMLRHQMVANDENEEEERLFSIYAYCLQPQFFYLLLKEEKVTVSKALSQLSCAYSCYLNNKYGKSGTSYRDRFHSEPVDDPARMDIVLRHIHQAPLTLKGVKNLDDYPYSSWHEYVETGRGMTPLCSLPDPYRLLTPDQRRTQLLTPLPEGTQCLGPKAFRTPKPSDLQVLGIVRLLTPATNWNEFRMMAYDDQLHTIKELLRNGASFRQLERLSGIGRGVIQRL